MAAAAPPLFAWPWEILGDHKWAIYGVLMAKAVYSWYQQEGTWSLHIFILCMLRLFMHQCWCSYTNMLYLTRNRLIVKKGVDFRQIDQEWHWDNFILLQGLVASLVLHIFPSSESVPLWNSYGVVAAVLVHALVSEPLFYILHRCFHGEHLFTHYHSLHHSSPVPQPYTAGHASFLEHLVLAVVIGVPVVSSFSISAGSIGLVYCYILAFDFLRCLGHSNVEMIPYQIFETIPFLRYVMYTPSYHNLHHEETDTNFCLFMPLCDALGNTLNKRSWTVHKQNSSNSGKNGRAPDFVFLAHVVDMFSAWHAPFFIRSIASQPYKTRLYMLPLWPIAFLSMLIMWAKSKAFLSSFYNLRGRLHQTWVVPRFGFQYFLPFAAQGINNRIEEAILRADRLGVKVISLAALNKNESLNEGGMLFVNKHPNLKVRVVHGNTLTAAVILKEIPSDVKEVFLTGSTSKLGRAIALYLCDRGVRVLMLTSSADRFAKVQKEAPIGRQKLLVQVTKYQAAQHCKTWILGKWITPREQNFAPAGAHFHQFVVPPVHQSRRDCTYGALAAMRLPEDVQELGCCEYTMGRGVVHACHAGGAVHSLEGWMHHEVGPIDVDRIDVVWDAAVRQGFRPVSGTAVP